VNIKTVKINLKLVSEELKKFEKKQLKKSEKNQKKSNKNAIKIGFLKNTLQINQILTILTQRISKIKNKTKPDDKQ